MIEGFIESFRMVQSPDTEDMTSYTKFILENHRIK